jgi:hypothetical protein
MTDASADRPGPQSPTVSTRHHRLLAAAIALLGAVAVFVLASEAFAYHSTNHDEGVYLQQAAMLLDGRLFLDPPVAESFRPWFFVDEPQGNPPFVAGGDLYSKYSPVAPAMFALGKLLGGYRVALGVIAGCNLWLVNALTSEAFDRRHGHLAAAFVALSPLFLIESAVFLAYAPTALWNLAFGVSYLRARRYGRDGETSRARRYALAAGAAVGVAFFSRPYTAVLFALPFVAHAGWAVVSEGRDVQRARAGATSIARETAARVRTGGGPLARNALTGAVGLAGVGTAVAYNAAVTGDPLVFPYQAFAPEDGLGLGHHEILGYEREYTLDLALEANRVVLDLLFTEWVAGGRVGTALAAVGLALFVGRVTLTRWRGTETPDLGALLLAGLFLTVAGGNVFFWGNLNVLGAIDEPGDGLVALLGPYYHFDLLLPTGAFAAHAAVVAGERLRAAFSTRLSPRRARVALAVLLLVPASAFGGVAVDTASDPIEENAEVGRQLSVAYEPFEDRAFTDALVFLPTPYGDWLNHPFQALRNDPDFDGDVVYALRENQFAVVDAFPNRTYYRYTFRGEWAPFFGTPVEPRLQRVDHVRGEEVRAETTLGIPAGADRVSMRLSSEEGQTYFVAQGPPDELTVTLHASDGLAWVTGEGVVSVDQATVPIDDRDELLLTVFVDYGAGNGFSYRIELPTATTAEGTRALTPYLEVCEVATRCGGEAAYVPESTRPGVSMNVTTTAGD